MHVLLMDEMTRATCKLQQHTSINAFLIGLVPHGTYNRTWRDFGPEG